MTTLRTPQTDLTTKRTRRRPSSRKMSSSSHITPRAGGSDFTANDPQQSPGRNSCMDPTLAYAKQSASHTNAKAKHLRHHAARDTQLVRRRHNPSYRATSPQQDTEEATQHYSSDRAATWQKHTPQWRLRPLRPISGPSNNKGTSAPPQHGSTRSQQPPRRQRHKHLCTSPSQLHPKQIQVVTVAARRASAASHSRGRSHLAPLHRLQARRKPTDIKQASTRRAAPMPAAASTKPARPALPHRSPTTSKPDLARARPRTQAPAHKATAAATTRHFGVASAPSRPSRRHCCLANPCRETCGAARNRARMLQPSLDEPRRRRKRTGFARR